MASCHQNRSSGLDQTWIHVHSTCLWTNPGHPNITTPLINMLDNANRFQHVRNVLQSYRAGRQWYLPCGMSNLNVNKVQCPWRLLFRQVIYVLQIRPRSSSYLARWYSAPVGQSRPVGQRSFRQMLECLTKEEHRQWGIVLAQSVPLSPGNSLRGPDDRAWGRALKATVYGV